MTKSKLSDMISELNMHLQEAGWQDRFVTLAAGQLNPIQHEVTFANAGHIAPLIYRLASDTFEEGTTSAQTGLPLGILEGIPYDSNTVSLGPGDCVLFMTDGITRIRKKDEKAFQQDLAIAALRAGPMVPRAMVGRLAAAVHRQVTGLERDELTVVAFGRVSTTSGDITEELNQYLARGSV